MNLNSTATLFLFILGIICLSGCELEEEQLIACGPYEPPEECSQYFNCFSTFYGSMELELLDNKKKGIYTDFQFQDGNFVVFHYSISLTPDNEIRQENAPFVCGPGYQLDILFQVPDNTEITSIFIGPSEFRDYKVYCTSVESSGIGVIIEDEGCIYLEKMNNNEWKVSINLTYFSIESSHEGELFGNNKVIQFTDTFKRGDV